MRSSGSTTENQEGNVGYEGFLIAVLDEEDKSDENLHELYIIVCNEENGKFSAKDLYANLRCRLKNTNLN